MVGPFVYTEQTEVRFLSEAPILGYIQQILLHETFNLTSKNVSCLIYFRRIKMKRKTKTEKEGKKIWSYSSIG